MAGLHKSVTMSSLLVDHTKFAPDWCFGLYKRRFHHTFVSSWKEITDVVESADVNSAQLVGILDEEVIVPVYDWTQFLAEHFRKVPIMKSYHYFTFSWAKPGMVYLKQFSDLEESSYCFAADQSWMPDSLKLPSRITPEGLSAKRQWYLHDHIREFCQRYEGPCLSLSNRAQARCRWSRYWCH